jgi:hypothetical protein
MFTHVDKDVRSVLDYWLLSSGVSASSVKAEGSTEAQHRPLQALLTFECPDNMASELEDRAPNLYFPSKNFAHIRKRLGRIAKNLREFPTVDALYEEILDAFVANGLSRVSRNDRGDHDLPWMAFVSDVELEVLAWTVYLFFLYQRLIKIVLLFLSNDPRILSSN